VSLFLTISTSLVMISEHSMVHLLRRYLGDRSAVAPRWRPRFA
jgi:hypothetical protein